MPEIRLSPAPSLGESDAGSRTPSPVRIGRNGTPLPFTADVYMSDQLLFGEHSLASYLPADVRNSTRARVHAVDDVVRMERPNAYGELRFGDFPALRPSDEIVREKLGAHPAEHMQVRHDDRVASLHLAIDVARGIANLPKYPGRAGAPRTVLVTNYPNRKSQQVYAVPADLDGLQARLQADAHQSPRTVLDDHAYTPGDDGSENASDHSDCDSAPVRARRASTPLRDISFDNIPSPERSPEKSPEVQDPQPNAPPAFSAVRRRLF